MVNGSNNEVVVEAIQVFEGWLCLSDRQLIVFCPVECRFIFDRVVCEESYFFANQGLVEFEPNNPI